MALTAKNMPYKQSLRAVRPARSTACRCRTRTAGGPAPRTRPEAAAEAIASIDKEIGAHNVAAIVIEPIAGRGRLHRAGARASCPALAEYAQAERHRVRRRRDPDRLLPHRRTGSPASDEGVVPDLITTAKGIAGGLPLAAVTGRAEIMDAVHVGGLGGTYGGNPVACAAALGAIETIEERGPRRRGPARSRRSCCRACTPCREARTRSSATSAGAARCSPSSWSSPGTLEPDAEPPPRSPRPATPRASLVLTAGTYGNVLRFLPPLVIAEHLLDEAPRRPRARRSPPSDAR